MIKLFETNLFVLFCLAKGFFVPVLYKVLVWRESFVENVTYRMKKMEDKIIILWKTPFFQITLFPNPGVHAFFASQLTVADAFWMPYFPRDSILQSSSSL